MFNLTVGKQIPVHEKRKQEEHLLGTVKKELQNWAN